MYVQHIQKGYQTVPCSLIQTLASVTKQFHVINVQLDVIHPRLFSTLGLKTITQLYDVNYIMLRKYHLMVY